MRYALTKSSNANAKLALGLAAVMLIVAVAAVSHTDTSLLRAITMHISF